MPLGREVGLASGDIVLDGDPDPCHAKGRSSRPTFRPMSIVAKRSPILATAELLYIQYILSRVLLFADVARESWR